jgi:YfiH family protein
VTESSVIIPDWPAPASLRAVITTRSMLGNSQPPFDSFNLGLRSGEDENIVRANRALLERALQLPSSPRWLQQVHGDRSLRVTEEIFDGEQQADAVFTTQPNIVLAILTADCLPILLCASDGSEIAAIHAGWRGLSAGIVESTIARLRTPRSKLLAWLGPAIGHASYEVGEEVRTAFVAKFSGAASAFVATRPGHWLCDLYALVRQKLHAVGVEKILGGNFDTFTDARFYSYRRDGARSGRFASVIWLT